MKENKIIEIRQISNQLTSSDNRTVNGYALVFNSLSEDLGGFREIIDPNALTDVIERSDVFALLNHDKEKGVLARSKNGTGTLILTVDERGLNYQFDAPNTDLGNTVLEHISRGEIDSSSFAFTVEDEKWELQPDGSYIRTILAFDRLFDCSPVFSPAYSDTSVALKRFLDTEKTNKELEERETTINIVISDNSTEVNEVSTTDFSTNVIVINEDADECEECKTMQPDGTTGATGFTEQCDLVDEVVDELINDDDEEEIEENDNCAEKRNVQEKIDNEISENKNNNKEIKQRKQMENFSLIKTINDVLTNRGLSDSAQEVINVARREMTKAGLECTGQIQIPVAESRGISEAVGAGIEAVATDKTNLELPLKANLTLVKAGARMYTGLKNNLSIPVYSGSQFSFEGETDAANDGSGTFTQVDFKPMRVTGYLPISKTLLAQDSANIEAGIMQDIVARLAEKLETVIFSAGAGSATVPAGLFNGVTGTTTPTYSGVTATIATLESAKVNSYKWIVNPNAKAAFKSTAKNLGKQIWEDEQIDGVDAFQTSLMPAKSYVVGDWNQYIIAQFGSLDILVDPYTLAGSNQIRLVINAYFDFKPLRPEAFAKGILA